MKRTTRAQQTRNAKRTNAATKVEEILANNPNLRHLRVTERGNAITIVAGEGPEAVLHARLTNIGNDLFGLSLPTWTDRWERTPFTGTIEELLELLCNDFGFRLSPR